MTQAEKRHYLITELLKELSEYDKIKIPTNETEQKKLLRSLLNIRMPLPVSDDFIAIQDKYLREETSLKGITSLDDLMPIQSDIYLWQGDITTLACDAIVNAANSEKLDCSVLKGRKMINLDSEEAGILTVSCAGGSDFKAFLPTEKTAVHGTKLLLEVGGLKGGHSGVDIDKCRVNANVLAARLLKFAEKTADFDIIRIKGGTKGNAIPFSCKAELVAKDAEGLKRIIEDYFSVVKNEISDREEDCTVGLTIGATGDFEVLKPETSDRLLGILLTTPNGVVDMSAAIDGLVETSLNLGILSTEDCGIVMQYALRSNKASALTFLEDRMTAFAAGNGCEYQISCRYEPWEFKKDSPLQKLYTDVFHQRFGHKPKIAAIHAGLECAVFAKKIEDLDCISIGPDMFDVHTVNERLSISSASEIFELLCDVLEKCR